MKELIFILLFFPTIFYSLVYTSGLRVKSQKNLILLEWFSNTNSYEFLIYKNNEAAILSQKQMESSRQIFSNRLEGKKMDDLYFFSYMDKEVKADQKNYYLVLPIDNMEILPNINQNISPVVFKISKDGIFIKEISGKIYEDSIILIWDASEYLEKPEFTIYRFEKILEEENIPETAKPYQTNVEDFYFEDFNIEKGKRYFYVVTVGENKKIKTNNSILMDNNFFSKEENIEVKKELLERVKIRKSEFLRHFKNGETNK